MTTASLGASGAIAVGVAGNSPRSSLPHAPSARMATTPTEAAAARSVNFVSLRFPLIPISPCFRCVYELRVRIVCTYCVYDLRVQMSGDRCCALPAAPGSSVAVDKAAPLRPLILCVIPNRGNSPCRASIKPAQRDNECAAVTGSAAPILFRGRPQCGPVLQWRFVRANRP